MKPGSICLVTQIHKITGYRLPTILTWFTKNHCICRKCQFGATYLVKDQRSHILQRNTTAYLCIFSQFVEWLDNVNVSQGYFHQDYAICNMSRECMAMVQNSFKDWVIFKDLLSTWLDLTPPNFFQWEFLKEWVFCNKPCKTDASEHYKEKQANLQHDTRKQYQHATLHPDLPGRRQLSLPARHDVNLFNVKQSTCPVFTVTVSSSVHDLQLNFIWITLIFLLLVH
jgi:hypothetical protein